MQADFNVLTHDKQGRQFGFDTADGEIQGHVDGIITDRPLPGNILFFGNVNQLMIKNLKSFNQKVWKVLTLFIMHRF